MKKGFTLVELLAVIVILSLIALIISSGVTRLVKKSKVKLQKSQTDLIMDAAEIWTANHMDLIIENDCIYIEIQQLEDEGLFSDTSILDTNIDLENSRIKVCSTVTNGTEKLTYEFVAKN